jgi:hypothetical protein
MQTHIRLHRIFTMTMRARDVSSHPTGILAICYSEPLPDRLALSLKSPLRIT